MEKNQAIISQKIFLSIRLQEKKNWNNLEKRLRTQFSRYDLWGAHYSRAYYNLRGMVLPTSNNNGVLWKLETNQKEAQIFTKNEKSPAGLKYRKPILINSSTSLTAFSKVNGKESGNHITENFSFNKATGKKIILKYPPSPEYPGNGGAFGLVNGVKSDKGITSTDWLGWRGSDMDAIIDLGKPVSVSRVVVHALSKGGSRVYFPNNVIVSGSMDGKNFSPLGSSQLFEQDKSENSGNITVKFAPAKVRYIQVTAKNYDKIPEGKTGAGEPGLMLVDEIEVN